MSFFDFENKTFRFYGMQMDARDFYTFSERWLFSTNHKYMVLYTYYSPWCGIIRFSIIRDYENGISQLWRFDFKLQYQLYNTMLQHMHSL